VLVGHDTGLAGQAGLLQLDWHNNVQTDDYPPAGALIYQLLEHHGHYAVRLFVAQPTLGALLAGEVTGKNAMRVAPLRLPTCGHRIECPLSRFDAIVQRVVEPAVIDTDSGHEPVAQ
jgi:4-phytase/acid phosphatase